MFVVEREREREGERQKDEGQGRDLVYGEVREQCQRVCFLLPSCF